MKTEEMKDSVSRYKLCEIEPIKRIIRWVFNIEKNIRRKVAYPKWNPVACKKLQNNRGNLSFIQLNVGNGNFIVCVINGWYK